MTFRLWKSRVSSRSIVSAGQHVVEWVKKTDDQFIFHLFYSAAGLVQSVQQEKCLPLRLDRQSDSQFKSPLGKPKKKNRFTLLRWPTKSRHDKK